jgi:hypothetical protein
MATATLTKKDQFRRDVAADLAIARRDLRAATDDENDAAANLKEAKERKKAAQIRVNDLSHEVEQIETGNYQPKLFSANGHAGKNGKAAGEKSKSKPGELPPDAGAALPIGELKNFGLTEAEVAKVEACPCHPKTIGEFEAWQRSDELWNRKIKGFGEEKITKLQDAHCALRLQYPMPTAEDVVDGNGDGKSPANGKASGKKKPKAAKSDNAPVIDRNAPGGEDCDNIAFRRTQPFEEHGAEVTVAVGIVTANGDAPQTFHSSTEHKIGDVITGRITPRQDSPAYATANEAARAALDELVGGIQKDRKSKKLAKAIAEWRDKEWPEGEAESASR